MKPALLKKCRLLSTDIEEYMPFEDDVAIICNEEGKGKRTAFEQSDLRWQETHEMMDIIAGTFFIAYAPVESEKFATAA